MGPELKSTGSGLTRRASSRRGQHDRGHGAVSRRLWRLELEFELQRGQLGRCHRQRGGELGAVTLNNLFQQQAGYSASDLAGMTQLFEKANPNIKVNNTLVAYEALHDKIVAAAPAGTYDVVLGDVHLAGRVRLQGDRQGHQRQRQHAADKPDLPGRAGDGQLQEQVLRDAVDPGHQVHVRQRLDAQEGGGARRPVAEDLERRGGRAQDRSRPRGIVKYPWLGSWSQAEAVVCDYAQLLGAFGGQVPGLLGQARVPDRAAASRRWSS